MPVNHSNIVFVLREFRIRGGDFYLLSRRRLPLEDDPVKFWVLRALVTDQLPFFPG
jgi:hypothetical protein